MNVELQPCQLSDLLEAPLQELMGLSGSFLQVPALSNYHQILTRYFSGDKQGLRLLIEKRPQFQRAEDPNLQATIYLASLRLSLLEKTHLIKSNSPGPLPSEWPEHWLGELYALRARWHDLREENQEAAELYSLAALHYRKIRCFRKELRCEFNSLICKDRVGLGESYHYYYYELLLRARRLKEHNVMVMASTALSQKMVDMGALQLALRFAQRALARASNEIGSGDYFKALLQRSFVYYLEGDLTNAQLDLKKSKISHHEEIRATALFLEKKYNGATVEDSPSPILFTGLSERVCLEKESFVPLGYLEERLLMILLMKPRTRNQLIHKIWGTSIAFDAGVMRLKDLLKRIRSKFPEVITFHKGVYSLTTLEKEIFHG